MARCCTWLACVVTIVVVANSSGAVWGQPASSPASSISADAVRRVKQATVLLRVSRKDEPQSEGSGFFAIGQGIIVTNAHVVGMLHAKSEPPAKIEVIVNSGSANELSLAGKLLGVDRSNDVAVLKVEGTLPTPLQFGKTEDLVETQKVYIFGFPFGTELGKNITVSESSVSSLRSDARQELTQIQVNGGMQPGNSGGPVVNAEGRVIGVSVAIVRNTQINFAIPGNIVRSLLAGKILDTHAGETFGDNAKVRVPLRYDCFDPFQRIREVHVEVWAGKPAENRAFSTKEAQPQAGDGPRRNVPLEYAQNVASGDVLLPKLTEGQVAWVQPVLTLPKGTQAWGTPQAIDAREPIERVAAELNVKQKEQQQRTVHLKASQSLAVIQGKNKYQVAQSAELDLLESFSPNPKGVLVTVGFGQPKLTVAQNGKSATAPADVVSLLQRIPPRFVVDETNKLRERADTNLNPRLPQGLREIVNEFLTQICNGYESATFVIPNRKVAPRESWPIKMPMLLKTGQKPEVIDLVMNCTFEGVRTKAEAAEALVSFAGTLQSRKPTDDHLDGSVAGKFTFDVQRGFISSSKMTISSESSSANGEIQVVLAFDVDLTRVEGNTHGISLPSSEPAPQVAAKRRDPMKGPKSPRIARAPSIERNEATGDFPFKGVFQKPAASSMPMSYLKVVSSPGDYIGQGKTYDYPGDQLNIKLSKRGVTIMVDGWHFDVGAPVGQFIKVGEYPDAKRFAFSGESPGLDFSGKGRGSNKLTGAFAVWELEIQNDQLVKLAIDFEQRSESRNVGLTGKLRLNSAFE